VRQLLVRSANGFVITLGLWGSSLPIALGQASSPPPAKPAAATSGAESAAKNAVVIERAPVVFRDPARYQVNLHLEPVRQLTLAAAIDGVVSSLQSKVGEEITPQAEAIRLDARVAQLKAQRAQAALKAAKAELASAKEKAAAEARVEVAQADLELADLEKSFTVIRSPMKGVVTAILVTDGQFVRAGQPLAVVTDPEMLTVWVPIDGKSQKAGDSIEIKIEDANVPATIESVLPLRPEFDPLRDLFVSPATGRIVLDNKSGKLRAGQTVHSPLIPRLPVAEVPTSAIANAEQGGRKVQVIREGFVRDIPVQLLGPVGADHVFVSGRFGVTDELVSKTSEPLVDGVRVTARDVRATSKPANASQPAQPSSGGASF